MRWIVILALALTVTASPVAALAAFAAQAPGCGCGPDSCCMAPREPGQSLEPPCCDMSAPAAPAQDTAIAPAPSAPLQIDPPAPSAGPIAIDSLPAQRLCSVTPVDSGPDPPPRFVLFCSFLI